MSKRTFIPDKESEVQERAAKYQRVQVEPVPTLRQEQPASADSFWEGVKEIGKNLFYTKSPIGIGLKLGDKIAEAHHLAPTTKDHGHSNDKYIPPDLIPSSPVDNSRKNYSQTMPYRRSRRGYSRRRYSRRRSYSRRRPAYRSSRRSYTRRRRPSFRAKNIGPMTLQEAQQAPYGRTKYGGWDVAKDALQYVPDLIDIGGKVLSAYNGGGDQIMGTGDYTVKTNSIVNPSTDVPNFNGGGGSVRIANKEFIQDIVTGPVAGVFNNTEFRLNPAANGTFPWLANIAQNFSEYRFHGLAFEYKTMSSDALNSTNTALGSVVTATQYNSYEAPLTTKQEMENYWNSKSCKPSCNLLHGVECSQFENPISVLYTSNGTPTVGDIRMYDLGIFNIATQGGQAANIVLGELWVTYDVEFLKPRQVDSGSMSDLYLLNPATVINTAWLSNQQIPVNGNNFGITFPDNNTLRFPESFVGSALISYYFTQVSAATTTPTIAFSGGTAELNIFNGGTEFQTSITGLTTTKWNHIIAVTCNQGGDVIFTSGTGTADPAPNNIPTLLITTMDSGVGG